MAKTERKALHETLSGIPVDPLYSPDTTPLDYTATLGDPGSYPYTRGPYESMHRGRLWTMRMFAGFGTADETNERFRYLLEQGQTGLSTAFDMPTLMGYDSDAPRSLGEVGREGVAIDTLADMEDLFDGHPAGRGHRLDDGQRARRHGARDVRLHGAPAGHPARRARRHDPDGHPQGVHRPEGVDLPARAVGAVSSST